MRRRQIRDVTVKAMALTGAPANGERFLMWKSMDAEQGREGWPTASVQNKSFNYTQWLSSQPGDDVANLSKGGPGSGPHKGGGSSFVGEAKSKTAERAPKREKREDASAKSSAAYEKTTDAKSFKTAGSHMEAARAHEVAARAAVKAGRNDDAQKHEDRAAQHRITAHSLKKSADSSVGAQMDISDTIGGAPQESTMYDELSMPSEGVLKSIQSIALAKSSSPEQAAAYEALGHIIHANPGLSMEGIFEMASQLDVDLSKSKKDDEEEDEEDDVEDGEDDGDEDEDDGEMPAFIKEKADARKKSKDSMKKSAHVPSNTEGEPMGAEQEKENLSKSHRELLEKHNALVERLEKTEGELNTQRHAAILKSIEAEVHSDFGHLPADVTELATIIKSLREKADQTEHDNLVRMLKATNAQLGMQRASGNSLFKANSRTSSINSAGVGTPMDQINAMIDQRLAKGGETKERHQLFEEIVATPEGRALWAQNAQGARN